jgi:RiboL-PSP-HEPN
MLSAIEQFRANLLAVRNLDAIYRAVNALNTVALDLSDILRAEIVMIVSALDQYVHEVTRLGMLEIYQGQRTQTAAFLQFPITMESALLGISAPLDESWLDDQIKTRHGFQSFQTPDKIANAVRLFSDKPLWNEVAARMNIPPDNLKQRLKLIIERRNKIAHEADSNPSFPYFPGKRWTIDEGDVKDSIDFIEQVAETIHLVVI